jgi:hypothetical protein
MTPVQLWPNNNYLVSLRSKLILYLTLPLGERRFLKIPCIIFIILLYNLDNLSPKTLWKKYEEGSIFYVAKTPLNPLGKIRRK